MSWLPSAVRTAIGAAPRHIVGQLLAESAILSVAGAIVGLIVALAAIPVVVAVTPVDIPRLDQAAVNLRVLGLALALVVGMTMTFGLVPSLVLVRLRRRGDAELEIWGARRKRALFEKVFDREMELTTHPAFG